MKGLSLLVFKWVDVHMEEEKGAEITRLPLCYDPHSFLFRFHKFSLRSEKEERWNWLIWWRSSNVTFFFPLSRQNGYIKVQQCNHMFWKIGFLSICIIAMMKMSFYVHNQSWIYPILVLEFLIIVVLLLFPIRTYECGKIWLKQIRSNCFCIIWIMWV